MQDTLLAQKGKNQINTKTVINNLTKILTIKEELKKHIIGQELFINRLLIALLADGHLLVEGAPGLAKTKAIKVLAEYVEAKFHRVQFTPDLLPADITGTEIYNQQTCNFEIQYGPIFQNLVLADEINRAPAKVQSALLEAMAERQITIASHVYKLPDLFLVMATQNPIEQEGTYPLPEAQLDRFLLHVNISYPDIKSEKAILQCVNQETKDELDNKNKDTSYNKSKNLITPKEIQDIRREILNIHISDNLEDYIINIIQSTRNPEAYVEHLKPYIEYGASPRATLALARTAKAAAWLNNRDYVIPDDIKKLAPDILRHRIILNFNAEAENITKDYCISEILQNVPVP
tara:strand:+ start:5056 stop:6099 length:1044 start_codon:yes stop_codon:yes gene_type:complete